MNGPEHYRESERLLGYASESAEAYWASALAIQAQAHAALALAAATVDAADGLLEGWPSALGSSS